MREWVEILGLFILVQIARFVPLVPAYLLGASLSGSWDINTWCTWVYWVCGIIALLGMGAFVSLTMRMFHD